MVKILKKNGQKSFNLILNYIIKKLKSINYVKYNKLKNLEMKYKS